MPVSLGFCICHLAGTLDAAQFTGVLSTGNWLGMTLLNDSDVDVALRTDPDDETTEYVMVPGGIFTVQAAFTTSNSAYRFTSGEVAFWLKPASGTGEGIRVVWA